PGRHARGGDDARDTDADPGDDEGQQPHPVDRHAGEARGLAVAAHGHDADAEGGPAQDQGQDDEHDHGDPDRPAQAEELAVGDVRYAVGQPRDDGAVRQRQGDPSGDLQHAQGGDERRHAQLGDDGAVGDADGGSGADAGQDAEDHRLRVAHDQGGDHAGQRDAGADREVELGGDDHEGHAEGDDREHRRLNEHVLEVVGRQELRRDDGEDDADDQEGDRHREEVEPLLQRVTPEQAADEVL